MHQQAMTYIYQQVLERLLGHFSPPQRTSLHFLIQRLLVAAGGAERVTSFTVLLAYGGGKDSSQTLALLRAAQLALAARIGVTFQIRVATQCRPGMTASMMINIQRCFSSLALQDDSRVQLLMVDDRYVLPFDYRRQPCEESRERSRHEILLNAHTQRGDVLASTHGDCYAQLASLYKLILSGPGRVNVIIVGDSPHEQLSFLRWAIRNERKAGVPRRPRRYWRSAAFLELLDTSGPGRPCISEHARHVKALRRNRFAHVHFMSIHDLRAQTSGEYWRLMTDFFRFEYHNPVFSISESGCAHPTLLAHLHGLRAEFVLDRCYDLGTDWYWRLAERLMRNKRMPVRLMERVLSRHSDPNLVQAARRAASQHALHAYGLTDTQLTCSLFAPIVNRGAELKYFLQRCHPGMVIALPYLHKVLRGHGKPEQVVRWLQDTTGLKMPVLRSLYRLQLRAHRK